jgi:sugar O-acyltransferase (sialic acid O-acetyltransferase NeuD family)
MRPVILWGASGHAKVLAEACGQMGRRVVALFDNDPARVSPWENVPLAIGEEGLLRWREQTGLLAEFALAIGGDRGRDRLALHDLLAGYGFVPLTVVHPTAFVAESAHLDAGCQVLARAAVCVEAKLGRQTIVNTQASVDHECVLGAGVHVAPGATLAGCVQVADGATIGAGAVVLPRLRIGSDAVVGAGAVVTRDIPDNAVAWGNPARVRRWKE